MPMPAKISPSRRMASGSSSAHHEPISPAAAITTSTPVPPMVARVAPHAISAVITSSTATGALLERAAREAQEDVLQGGRALDELPLQGEALADAAHICAEDEQAVFHLDCD